jgi:hypothetical protein
MFSSQTLCDFWVILCNFLCDLWKDCWTYATIVTLWAEKHICYCGSTLVGEISAWCAVQWKKQLIERAME